MIFSIGKVAKMYDISHDTLRYYDKVGILKPSIKKENGYRYYSIRDAELLEIILICKQLEIPIKDIKEIIEKEDINAYEVLFKKHEEILAQKIRYLGKLKEKVSVSKEVCTYMKNFENNDSNIKYEDIDNTYVFFTQDGNSYMAVLEKDKNIVMIVDKIKNNELTINEELLGVEATEEEIESIYKNVKHIKKVFKGRYKIIERKGTSVEIDAFINRIIDNKEKYLKEENYILIETLITLYKKKGSNIYLVKIYIKDV